VFRPFIYISVLGPENINFRKGVSKGKLLKMIPLLFPCKLKEREFLNMGVSCACVLHVQSIGP